MKGQTIGKTMPHGYAGSYSRQPDMVVDTHPLAGSQAVIFGLALVYGADGAVLPFGADGTAAKFVGVAAREIKSATNYLDQNTGAYQPGEAVPVFKRGRINVVCQKGTPAIGGKVYVRTKASESYPNAVVGGFEAEADTTGSGDSAVTNTVELTNVQWRGGADGNGVAELCLLTMNNA